MANSIEFAKNYTDILDEVYQRAAVSRCLNSGGRMVRAGRNAKEILIPKIEVTGLGDYTRNVGYKTAASLRVRNAQLRLRPGHPSVRQRHGRRGSWRERLLRGGGRGAAAHAGDPGGRRLHFSQIASTEGVTVKGEDLSEASAVDVLAALRAVTNDMDEKQVSTGSRYLFITPTLRGVLDDFSLANPTRSNRVLERFSRIVEVPQMRFYTAFYGFGAGLPVTDEDGRYTRRPASKPS